MTTFVPLGLPKDEPKQAEQTPSCDALSLTLHLSIWIVSRGEGGGVHGAPSHERGRNRLRRRRSAPPRVPGRRPLQRASRAAPRRMQGAGQRQEVHALPPPPEAGNKSPGVVARGSARAAGTAGGEVSFGRGRPRSSCQYTHAAHPGIPRPCPCALPLPSLD